MTTRSKPSRPTALRDQLDALIAGTAPAVSNVPTEECFEISQAIVDCVDATIEDYRWGRSNPDALACPSALLPPLP